MNLHHPRMSSGFCAALLLTGVALFGFGSNEAARDAAPTPAPAPAGAPSAPAAASPAPAVASPSATPAATPDMTIEPTYDGSSQSRYIKTASDAFLAQRTAKFQAFTDARNAFEAAGGVNAQGLTSKAVTERRALLAPVRTANDDYLAFIITEEEVYRAELAKTPLVPRDVYAVTEEFATKANIPHATKWQQCEQAILTSSDNMLADLEKWSGEWSVSATGKLTIKKRANQNAYIAEQKKYNAAVEMQRQLTAATPSPAAAASPTPAAPPASTPKL